MEITRKAIEARKAQYQQDREQATATVQQFAANINALDGAIQDCDYWLGQLPPDDEPEPAGK